MRASTQTSADDCGVASRIGPGDPESGRERFELSAWFTSGARARSLVSLIRLPWTVTVEESHGCMIARVRELPDAIATGDTERELALDLWQAVEASLAIRLDNGDDIPLPEGSRLPWAVPSAQITRAAIVINDPSAVEAWTPPGNNLVAAQRAGFALEDHGLREFPEPFCVRAHRMRRAFPQRADAPAPCLERRVRATAIPVMEFPALH